MKNCKIFLYEMTLPSCSSYIKQSLHIICLFTAQQYVQEGGGGVLHFHTGNTTGSPTQGATATQEVVLRKPQAGLLMTSIDDGGCTLSSGPVINVLVSLQFQSPSAQGIDSWIHLVFCEIEKEAVLDVMDSCVLI